MTAAHINQRRDGGRIVDLATGEMMLSPSLTTAADAAPAFELKFLLDEARAAEVEAWGRSRLTPDVHGDAALGGYRTTSLYFDTPEWDVFHRSPKHKRRKFRIRRYGTSNVAFLERKSKWGDRVAKRRSAIPDDEMPLLAHPMSLVEWPGHWFHLGILKRRLGPACRIAYLRTAFVGVCADGPLRLTLDRDARGVLARDWGLGPVENGLPLLHNEVIVEFKFRTALPAPFKELARDLALAPSPVSKFRRCLTAWGVPGRLREAVDA